AAYGQKGDLDRAIADYTAAIGLDPGHADAYYNRGAAYVQKGDFDRAIADYSAAIGLNPGHANAFYNRGAAYGNKGDLNRAIADFDTAIGLDPGNAGVLTNRSIAYYEKGQNDQSLLDYRAAIVINKYDAKALFVMAELLAKNKIINLSIDAFSRAVSLNPIYIENYQTLKQYFGLDSDNICDALEEELTRIYENYAKVIGYDAVRTVFARHASAGSEGAFESGMPGYDRAVEVSELTTTVAPKLWKNRSKDNASTPIEFIQANYGQMRDDEWHHAGLTRSDLKRDPELYAAYATWIGRHPDEALTFASGGRNPGLPRIDDPAEAIERRRQSTREANQRYREKLKADKMSHQPR
ncbi:tetratricopeptide repeat protein, partial [Lichenifustis flavocetrariae]